MATTPIVVPQIPPTAVSPIDGSGPFTLPWRKFFQYLSTLSTTGSVTPEQIAEIMALAQEALTEAQEAIMIAQEALSATAIQTILPYLALEGVVQEPNLSVLDYLSIGALDVVGGITQLTGDVTAGPGAGAVAATLATVNPDVGSFGNGTVVAQFTVDAKGRITAAADVPITSAPEWTTTRTQSFTGDVTGGPTNVDGSASWSTALTLAATQAGAHTWNAGQTFTAGITVGTTMLMASNVNLTNGAGAAAGTLTTAPSAGDPTKWVPINDNGTTRYIPAW